MTERSGNRITLRPAGGEPASERHVTDVPADLARYVGSSNGTEPGHVNMYDNRGLLEQPPSVRIAGDLIPGVAQVLIENGSGSIQIGEQVLTVHVPIIGRPIRREPVRTGFVGSRARFDRGTTPISGAYVKIENGL